MLAGLLATTGCSLFGGGPTEQDEAAALAKALSSGRLTGLSYAGGTPQQAQQLWTRTVEGLGHSTPTVRVAHVVEGRDGKPGTAELSYRWKLAGSTKPWTYTTTAQLLPRDGGDGWRVRLAPTLVPPGSGPADRLTLGTSLADRAQILGTGGTPIVKERPVLRFGLDKTRVPPSRQADSARALARRSSTWTRRRSPPG